MRAEPHVAVPVSNTALVDRISAAIAANYSPRTIDSRSVAGSAHGVGADDRHVAARIAYCALHKNVAVAVLCAALINRIAVSVATDNSPGAINVYRRAGARERPAQNLGVELRRRSEARQR